MVEKNIRRQLRRLNGLIAQLLGLPAGLRGSFARVYTRCGKVTCWCAQGTPGHPHHRITWSEDGQLRTRKVPLDQVPAVIRLTRNYRRFRALRRQLRAAQTDLAGGINRYEQSLIDRTRSTLKFLPPPTKTVARVTRHRQKRRIKRKTK